MNSQQSKISTFLKQSAAPAKATECPLRPLIPQLNALIATFEAMEAKKPLNNDIETDVHERICTIWDYASILRAQSPEGALLQLGVIIDKLEEMDQDEYRLASARRAIRRLVFSIAGVLAKHAGEAANEPAIAYMLLQRTDPQNLMNDYVAMPAMD